MVMIMVPIIVAMAVFVVQFRMDVSVLVLFAGKQEQGSDEQKDGDR